MKLTAALALAASASALAIERRDDDKCCFTLDAEGGVSGTVGQLDDGQNRVGGDHPPAHFCLENGAITDDKGRGCILTAPTTQLQCDEGANPTTGFSVNQHGMLEYQGSTQFIACNSGDGHNIYTNPDKDDVTGCYDITLTADGCRPPSTCEATKTHTVEVTNTAAVTETQTVGATGSAAVTQTHTVDVTNSHTVAVTVTQTVETCAPQPPPETTHAPPPPPETTHVPPPPPETTHVPPPPQTTHVPPPPPQTTHVPPPQSPTTTHTPSPPPQSSHTPSPPPVSSSQRPTTLRPTTTKAPSGSCPTDLSGDYEYPHLIVPIDSAHPNKAEGTSYFGRVSDTISTIFDFDIPAEDSGKTCSLVFLFPKQEDLETSSFTFSGDGKIDVSKLQSPATEKTTFKNAPGVAQDYGTTTIAPGNSYLITTFDCPAGQRIGFEVSNAGSTDFRYFQDYNPSPIGLYITTC